MKKAISLSFMVLLLWSCTSRTIYKKPEGLIDKEQMIDIWTDLYIASGARSVKTKTLEKDINYIPLVLRKYRIDSVQFSESNLYYTSRIEEYEKMFIKVQERLEEMKNSYQPKNNRDSMIELSKKKFLEKKAKN